ncbi:MAG: hypothetical protein AB1499_14930 [Nitrospirota bacterium]
MKDLGTLGGTLSEAYGINDKGQIVGYSETSSGSLHAFLYEKGEMKDLGTLGGLDSYGRAINNSGMIVGYSDTPSGESHAFLYDNAVMNDLGTLFGIKESRAFSINNSGQIVGWSDSFIAGWRHAVLWDPYKIISSLR